MPFPEFGPFASVFEKEELEVPGYLKLLHLGGDGNQAVIDRIERAFRVGDPRPWVTNLLQEPNWRPNLVGAVAFLFDDNEMLDRGLLWHAIDVGSWVTPQLVVTAYFTDTNFSSEVRDRVDKKCPVKTPTNLTPVERHSATGPAGTFGRRAKMLASLLTISSMTSSLKEWAETFRNMQEMQDLLKEDATWDGSDRITASWLDAVSKIFLQRGHPLKPRTI
jgi:hypothetical protein